MSVKNLRNKFNQNNSTVPYNPPGLSYAKPTVSTNNNNKINNHGTSNGYQQKGGMIGGRFKTIREEPDADEKPAVTKNNSFLQSYLHQANNEPTNGGKVNNVPVQQSARFVSGYRPSAVVADPPSSSKPTVATAVKSLSTAPAVPYPSKFAILKSPDSSRYTVKSSPPPPPVPPPVLENRLTTATGVDDKWRTKYDETETKRKNLLTQSQKREFPQLFSVRPVDRCSRTDFRNRFDE